MGGIPRERLAPSAHGTPRRGAASGFPARRRPNLEDDDASEDEGDEEDAEEAEAGEGEAEGAEAAPEAAAPEEAAPEGAAPARAAPAKAVGRGGGGQFRALCTAGRRGGSGRWPHR